MFKKFIATAMAVLLPAALLAQTYPSPTYNNVTIQGNLNLPSEAANSVMVSPDGSAGVPDFRALVTGDIPSLAASKITSGTFADARIPSLDAAKIVSGTFAEARIPSLDAAKIATGVLPVLRGGTGVTTSTGTGNNVLSANPTLSGGVQISAAVGSARSLDFATSNTNRWTVRPNSTAEAGSNAGSDLEVVRRDDAGAALGTPIFVRRSDGQVGINTTAPTEPLTVSGNTRITGNLTVLGTTNMPSQTANTIFAAPNGSAGVPSFRTMVAADVPSLDTAKITTGTLPVVRGGTGTTTSTGSGSVVLNTSPSFTTDLTVNGAAATNRNIRFTTANALRWQLIGNNNAEGGSNAGTNFGIGRYDDAGAFLSLPFWIERATGEVGINNTNPGYNLDVGGTFNVSGDARVGGNIIQSAAAGTNRLSYFQTAGSLRWISGVNSIAETGSNVGSNYVIDRFSDAGAYLGNALTIDRATGNLTTNNTTINFTTPSAANTNFNGAGMEMFWTGGPYIDFKNDAATDFDVRMQLVDDDTLEFQGNTIVNGNTTVIANIINDALPNLSKSVQGTGVPGLDGGHWMVWNNQTGSTFDPTPTLRIDRNASPSVVAGVPANTYQAVKINGTAGVNNQGYEWPLTVEMHNYSLASLNAENVAINGTAWLEANGVGETGKTWGANFNVSDKTTTVNPTKGRVALELDTYAHPSGSTDSNRARVGLQIAVGTHNGVAPSAGTPLHIGRGFLVGANQANVIMDRLMEVGGLGTYDIGIDTTGATFTKPVMFMKETQRIAFDGNTSGTYNRSLRYDAGQLIYASQNGNVMQLSDTGTITAGHASTGGVKLSLTNSAGTCTLTPTATTASFACSSDERLKQNIEDFSWHGGNWLDSFRIREYDIKATGERAVGVIAQEVQKTHPEMVKPQTDGMLSVEAPNPWMLVKALQEQQAEISLLKIWLGILSVVVALMGFVVFRRMVALPR